MTESMTDHDRGQIEGTLADLRKMLARAESCAPGSDKSKVPSLKARIAYYEAQLKPAKGEK